MRVAPVSESPSITRKSPTREEAHDLLPPQNILQPPQVPGVPFPQEVHPVGVPFLPEADLEGVEVGEAEDYHLVEAGLGVGMGVGGFRGLGGWGDVSVIFVFGWCWGVFRALRGGEGVRRVEHPQQQHPINTSRTLRPGRARWQSWNARKMAAIPLMVSCTSSDFWPVSPARRALSA